MIIAVDFDGTIVEHRYPDIGEPVPGAFKWLKRYREHGVHLILYTMRCDSESQGPVLTDAIEFCKKNGLEFDSVNDIDCPWSNSRKVYASVYIDDSAFGCPLVESKRMGGRPYVDWDVVGPAIMRRIDPRYDGIDI